MNSQSVSLDPPRHESELSQLIKSFSAARSGGDRIGAYRSIDRAWRLSQDNPEISFLYGRFLLAIGETDRAINLLESAAQGRAYPDYEAAYISALCTGGRMELALQRLEAALTSFVTIPDGALAQSARQVTIATAANYPGWLGIGPAMGIHGEIIGKTGTVRLEVAGDTFQPQLKRIKCDEQSDHTQFQILMEHALAPGHMTVRSQDKILLGGKRDFPPDFGFDGRVGSSDGVVTGWTRLKWDPSRALALSVSGEHGFAMPLMTTPDSTQLDRHLFSFELESCRAAGNALTISATMPDGTVAALPASPFLIEPTQAPRRTVAATAPPAQDETVSRAIDVVIPVYSGFEETLCCIRSVIATVKSNAEIVVVDDASPEGEIRTAIDELAAAGKITLLRNPENLGFPGAANRGMALHPDRDIVILNADTEVYGDWLIRLRAAAYGAPRIATVTPLTNSGSIATYPATEFPELSSGAAIAYDRLTARENDQETVDIPTGVGFCQYLRRDCMNEVGYFDAELFLKGYGEENDFCMRAAEAGWKHVLAVNIYVRHTGSRSFGGRRAALYDRNLRLLNIRYPGYDEKIQDYLARDPAHRARRRLDEARLTAAGETYVLVVSLGLEGGVSRAVRERIATIESAGTKAILLTPNILKKDRCDLTLSEPGFDDLYYDFAKEPVALTALLGDLKLDRIELHHFLDLPPNLIDRLCGIRSPVDIKIHDYIWYCPQVTLLDETNRYCGEPDIDVCESCVQKNGSRLKETITVSALRLRSYKWLKAARSITVPSASVAKRMEAKFPALTFAIEPLETDIPDPVALAATAKARGKVALIGAIGDHKGYEILLGMAKDAAARDLPLDFVVIGFTKDDKSLIETGRVFVTGRYEEQEVEALIGRENPDLILFLSVFPETWCYTLTYALRARVPVAAIELGAIVDRLAGSAAAPLLFPLSSDPTEICNRLLAALTPPQARRQGGTFSSLRPNAPSLPPANPDNLANAALYKAAKNLRTNMAPTDTTPTASMNFFPLTSGLYLFSVRSSERGQPVAEHGGVILPAMQVSAGPGTAAGQIEFMTSPQTQTGWLREPNDQIVAKVMGGGAVVALNSVMIPGMTPLEIEIQRLGPPEKPEAASTPARAVAAPPALPQLPTRQSARLQIVPHIQNHGDAVFAESEWAGMVGQGVWIESFAITPLEAVSANAIEYMAITATGVETPWVSDGAPCGTRGIGVPLTGFAVRGKAQPGSPAVTCEYGAITLSGKIAGPVSDGTMCVSAEDGDPIAAIWVSIAQQEVALESKPVLKRRPTVAAPKLPENKPAPAAVVEAPAKIKKAPLGPRFSVFRQSGKSDQE